MKNLNLECQNSFLNAMGVDISYDKSKISWELYINLNALLRFNTASFLEYVNFFVKVMDPYQNKIVPKDQFEETLRSLFKGQFKLKGEIKNGIQSPDAGDDEAANDDMSVDIRRGLEEKGVLTKDGDLDIRLFEEGLHNGNVDIEIFKTAFK